MRVSAVVVSRMDHSLGEVVDSIAPHVEEIIIVRGRDGVWQRWDAILSMCNFEVAYTQDDDAVIDVGAAIAQYEAGKIICNMPPDHRRDYPDDIALVGWGAICRRAVAQKAWGRYLASGLGFDDIFARECDRVVTGLSPLRLIDVPIRHLPQAHGVDRMGREARHGADLQEIRRRIYAIRSGK